MYLMRYPMKILNETVKWNSEESNECHKQDVTSMFLGYVREQYETVVSISNIISDARTDFWAI